MAYRGFGIVRKRPCRASALQAKNIFYFFVFADRGIKPKNPCKNPPPARRNHNYSNRRSLPCKATNKPKRAKKRPGSSRCIDPRTHCLPIGIDCRPALNSGLSTRCSIAPFGRGSILQRSRSVRLLRLLSLLSLLRLLGLPSLLILFELTHPSLRLSIYSRRNCAKFHKNPHQKSIGHHAFILDH